MGLAGFVWVTSVFGMSRARRGTTWTQDSGVAWIRHADVRAGARQAASHQGPQPVAPCVKFVQSSAPVAAFCNKSRTVESTPRTPRSLRSLRVKPPQSRFARQLPQRGSQTLRSLRSLREFLPPRPPRGGERKATRVKFSRRRKRRDGWRARTSRGRRAGRARRNS